MKCTKIILQKPDYEIYEKDSRIYVHIYGGPTVEFPTEEEIYEQYKDFRKEES